MPIDLVVDNVNKEFLVKILQKRLSGRPLHNLGGYASVGDKYCIVPYLRGTPKSETIKNLVKKVRNLDQSIKEVIFTAINTEAFGYDTGETLIQLIQQTLTDSTVYRISFGSIHPWSINDEFLRYYKKILPLKRLVNFFHVPI